MHGWTFKRVLRLHKNGWAFVFGLGLTFARDATGGFHIELNFGRWQWSAFRRATAKGSFSKGFRLAAQKPKVQAFHNRYPPSGQRCQCADCQLMRSRPGWSQGVLAWFFTGPELREKSEDYREGFAAAASLPAVKIADTVEGCPGCDDPEC